MDIQDTKWMDYREEAASSNEPIIIGRATVGDNSLPSCLSAILRIQCDEDGTYIITDHKTVVYGDGDTIQSALCDYIISLIEYTELLAYDSRRESKEFEQRVIREFIGRVEARAERNIEKTGKLEGAHYAAIKAELLAMEKR